MITWQTDTSYLDEPQTNGEEKKVITSRCVGWWGGGGVTTMNWTPRTDQIHLHTWYASYRNTWQRHSTYPFTFSQHSQDTKSLRNWKFIKYNHSGCFTKMFFKTLSTFQFINWWWRLQKRYREEKRLQVPMNLNLEQTSCSFARRCYHWATEDRFQY